jgi:large subunit ribosomal protein L15
MYLNTIAPAEGSTKDRKRVGRGIGSGLGKTCGRGHKGQKSRSGGYHKINFEGGQMPLQRRLPKFGFKSRISRVTDQITLSELNKVEQDIVDLDVLKANGLINKHIQRVKVILSGSLEKAVKLKGIKATKGAKEAIEAAGGSIEE